MTLTTELLYRHGFSQKIIAFESKWPGKLAPGSNGSLPCRLSRSELHWGPKDDSHFGGSSVCQLRAPKKGSISSNDGAQECWSYKWMCPKTWYPWVSQIWWSWNVLNIIWIIFTFVWLERDAKLWGFIMISFVGGKSSWFKPAARPARSCVCHPGGCATSVKSLFHFNMFNGF